MAITKRVLKKTHTDAIVKVFGTAGTANIDLIGDLLLDAGEFANANSNVEVTIAGLMWTGNNDAVITISRANLVIYTLAAEASNMFDFTAQTMIPDDTNANANIRIQISGTHGELSLRLRKRRGYASGLEGAEFGNYDNPNVVGS